MMKPMKKLFTFGLFWGVVLFIFTLAFVIQTQRAKASEQGGTIKGTVNSPYVSRYPALVYIDHVDGEFPLPKENPHMSQKGMVFMPHILPVLKGSTVDFTNDDTVDHNVFSPPRARQHLLTSGYTVPASKRPKPLIIWERFPFYAASIRK